MFRMAICQGKNIVLARNRFQREVPLVLMVKLVYHREEQMRKAPESADKGAEEYFITGMY
jgi:hypothetical protein